MLYSAHCTGDALENVPTRDLVVNEMCPSTRVPARSVSCARDVPSGPACRRYLMRLWIAVLTRNITSEPKRKPPRRAAASASSVPSDPTELRSASGLRRSSAAQRENASAHDRVRPQPDLRKHATYRTFSPRRTQAVSRVAVGPNLPTSQIVDRIVAVCKQMGV